VYTPNSESGHTLSQAQRKIANHIWETSWFFGWTMRDKIEVFKEIS